MRQWRDLRKLRHFIFIRSFNGLTCGKDGLSPGRRPKCVIPSHLGTRGRLWIKSPTRWTNLGGASSCGRTRHVSETGPHPIHNAATRISCTLCQTALTVRPCATGSATAPRCHRTLTTQSLTLNLTRRMWYRMAHPRSSRREFAQCSSLPGSHRRHESNSLTGTCGSPPALRIHTSIRRTREQSTPSYSACRMPSGAGIAPGGPDRACRL